MRCDDQYFQARKAPERSCKFAFAATDSPLGSHHSSSIAHLIDAYCWASGRSLAKCSSKRSFASSSSFPSDPFMFGASAPRHSNRLRNGLRPRPLHSGQTGFVARFQQSHAMHAQLEGLKKLECHCSSQFRG